MSVKSSARLHAITHTDGSPFNIPRQNRKTITAAWKHFPSVSPEKMRNPADQFSLKSSASFCTQWICKCISVKGNATPSANLAIEWHCPTSMLRQILKLSGSLFRDSSLPHSHEPVEAECWRTLLNLVLKCLHVKLQHKEGFLLLLFLELWSNSMPDSWSTYSTLH